MPPKKKSITTPKIMALMKDLKNALTFGNMGMMATKNIDALSSYFGPKDLEGYRTDLRNLVMGLTDKQYNALRKKVKETYGQSLRQIGREIYGELQKYREGNEDEDAKMSELPPAAPTTGAPKFPLTTVSKPVSSNPPKRKLASKKIDAGMAEILAPPPAPRLGPINQPPPKPARLSLVEPSHARPRPPNRPRKSPMVVPVLPGSSQASPMRPAIPPSPASSAPWTPASSQATPSPRRRPKKKVTTPQGSEWDVTGIQGIMATPKPKKKKVVTSSGSKWDVTGIPGIASPLAVKAPKKKGVKVKFQTMADKPKPVKVRKPRKKKAK